MNDETKTPEAAEEAAKPETTEEAETEQEPRRKKRRWETCRECGESWNISINARIPPAGYLCPRCWSKYRSK